MKKKTTKTRQLTHDTAAKREHYCPMCRSISYDAPEPTVYTCPECGSEGFDCCIAGTNCICVQCEESR